MRPLIAASVPSGRSDVACTGVLAVDEHGRVTFGAAVLVAAPGSSTTPDGLVHLLGFGTHRLGDVIRVGGARLPSGSPYLPAEAETLPGPERFFAYEP